MGLWPEPWAAPAWLPTALSPGSTISLSSCSCSLLGDRRHRPLQVARRGIPQALLLWLVLLLRLQLLWPQLRALQPLLPRERQVLRLLRPRLRPGRREAQCMAATAVQYSMLDTWVSSMAEYCGEPQTFIALAGSERCRLTVGCPWSSNPPCAKSMKVFLV